MHVVTSILQVLLRGNSNRHYNATMIARSNLKNVLAREGLSRKQKVLLCLAVGADEAKSPADIRGLALDAGVRAAKTWNFSAILASLGGLVARTSKGWELTENGKHEARRVLGGASPAAANALGSLRAAASKLKSDDVRAFVEESIACAEAGYHRAAVVLSWVGALAVLYDVVVRDHLKSFNAEATRRDAKWRAAKTTDDLARMKEFDFLQILEALSVLGKSTKNELEGCLKLRNGSGHPNSLKISDNRVAAHIETLVLNVFSAIA